MCPQRRTQLHILWQWPCNLSDMPANMPGSSQKRQLQWSLSLQLHTPSVICDNDLPDCPASSGIERTYGLAHLLLSCSSHDSYLSCGLLHCLRSVPIGLCHLNHNLAAALTNHL